MDFFNEIGLPVLLVGGLALLFGILLAIASKVFAVHRDARVDQVKSCLPGANCGGCGYAGCDALAEAVVKGEAPPSACVVSDSTVCEQICKIVGTEAKPQMRMRAQVFCSGGEDVSKKKYIYEGAKDCAAAAKLGGGDLICPNGCVGFGTCVSVCAFNAIAVKNGVAEVDYTLCKGCGACVNVCPKHIIRLIPFDSNYWVGCISADLGSITQKYCKIGCIGCKICEKNCPTGAITVSDYVASIDQSKCTECGLCAEKCPRKIIRFGKIDKNR